jgi:AraC-like DNA-binding protein
LSGAVLGCRALRGLASTYLFEWMTNVSPRIVEFSTDLIPERDRAAIWREHYGQIMLRVDLEPEPGVLFEARNRALSVPGLQLMEAQASPVRVSRNGRYLADGNDDVVVAINRAGSALFESAGRSHILREGEAIILSGGEPTSFRRTTSGKSFTLLVPRATIESTVVGIDDALMRPIPTDHGVLRLLDNYAGWLLDNGNTIEPQLLNLSVRHVQDLLALTIGPAADLADTVRARGLRAARLKLAKSFIIANSHRRDISITALAAKLNVTPRYVQRLFEADGTTFSEFVTRLRLSRAHRILCEPASNQAAIATIAYDVGFGDLSYFNRRFRRQYGLTPREVRGDRAR